jgi:hypothetical protein
VRTIDNIAMASPEYKQIVLKENGRNLILKVMEIFKDIPDSMSLIDICKSALLTIGAEPEKKKVVVVKKPALKEVLAANPVPEKSVAEIEFEGFANKLKAGHAFTMWTKDGKHTSDVVVKINSTVKEVLCSGKGGKTIVAVDLANLIQINNDEKFMKKNTFSRNPKADCVIQLYMKEKDLTIYLETGSSAERDQWTEMFNSIIRYRKIKKM